MKKYFIVFLCCISLVVCAGCGKSIAESSSDVSSEVTSVSSGIPSSSVSSSVLSSGSQAPAISSASASSSTPPASSSAQVSSETLFIAPEIYTFTGETHVEVDGRTIELEDTPINYAEDIVAKDFLYTITGEFSKKYDIFADIEMYTLFIENDKKAMEDEIYIQSYVIHQITTLTKEQYAQEQAPDGGENPLHHYNWQKIVDKYKLKEYEIIIVNFTQTFSSKAYENGMGPQWGDGTYNRSFIIGKTSVDSSYRIYDLA